MPVHRTLDVAAEPVPDRLDHRRRRDRLTQMLFTEPLDLTTDLQVRDVRVHTGDRRTRFQARLPSSTSLMFTTLPCTKLGRTRVGSARPTTSPHTKSRRVGLGEGLPGLPPSTGHVGYAGPGRPGCDGIAVPTRRVAGSRGSSAAAGGVVTVDPREDRTTRLRAKSRSGNGARLHVRAMTRTIRRPRGSSTPRCDRPTGPCRDLRSAGGSRSTCIRAATVAVEDDPGSLIAAGGDGHLERVGDELGAHVGGHRVAEEATRTEIEDRRTTSLRRWARR